MVQQLTICGNSQAFDSKISHPLASRKKNENDRDEERKEKLQIGLAQSKTTTTPFTSK